MSERRVLLYSMYPLDGDMYGPVTRITHLRDALAQRVKLDVIAGHRAARAWQAARYVASGRLGRLSGIYVETATTLPGPADVALLAAGRARGIPVLTYVRDAQSLFAEYYRPGSPKRWLSRRLFLPAFRILIRLSSRVAFPSLGLAAVFGRSAGAVLLPPGAPEPVDVPRQPDANRLLFVGGMRYPVHGKDILFEAIEGVRASGIGVELTCVSRVGEEPPAPHPGWLHVARASGSGIHALLGSVVASVTPRRRSPYNDLGVPVKVVEYLSYGRPLLVTDCTETANIVRSAGAGLVVEDSARGLTAGITALMTAAPDELDAYSAAARQAARAHSWERRADKVLDVLKLGP